MTWPNFLIIGAQKAGTTSLYEYLRQHPQIFMSDNKEPHYFLDGTLKAWQYYQGQQIRLWDHRVTTRSDYQALFAKVAHETAIGEASVWYLYRPEAAAKIKQQMPDVKLIAMLRHPVERCFSDFKQGLTLGYETETDFLTAVQADQHCHYVAQGFYHRQISRYHAQFEPQQLKICLYDDLRDNPLTMCRQIFQFLEVDDTFKPNVSTHHNLSPSTYQKVRPNHAFLQRLWGNSPVIVPLPTRPSPSSGPTFAAPHSWLRKLRSYSLLWLTNRRFRQRLAVRLMRRGGLLEVTQFQPILDAQARQTLTSLYRPDILKLQTYLQRDLSAWLT